MSTVKIEIQLSSEVLLQAVQQLNQLDLEQFISQVMILHTQRKSASLLKEEVELFLTINDDISSETHDYYHKLITTVEEERLTNEEYKELLYLSEQIDKLQAHRLEYLADLARLHGISLTELVQNLGFQT
ncbi:STAS/SEC14 domain-containing protein [Anabaena cylindrica UHCC 0172]|uniref:STAS/SEC14 domain-containing protein n=1 Tax=Anabaena cylindrica TaxID=1165 RepID=UPI002B1FB9B3|nr:STAS/SEC14 domain-containing protein [Anabaena cylindrica]MEA5554687.1 STAS/SEC14 domain-containing protein [Anabaena cylindrica UHCC 0172]